MKTFRFPRGLSLLLELIAAVTIFAVAAGICAQLLTQAEKISRDAQALDRAVAAVSSAAEELRASDDPSAVLASIEAHPNMSAEVRPEGLLTRYRLCWTEDGAEVWSLDIVCMGEVAP